MSAGMGVGIAPVVVVLHGGQLLLEPAHVAPEGAPPQRDGRQHEDRRDPTDHFGAMRLLPPAVGVNWSFRFSAHAASSFAGLTGRSSPYDTMVIWLAETP